MSASADPQAKGDVDRNASIMTSRHRTNRLLTGVLYVILFAVVLSSLQTLWVGLADKARYQAILPGARGSLYWTTLVLSSIAGANAICIGLRRRWAVRLNPLIGLSSIAGLRAVGSPPMNQVVVLIACLASTLLPCYLWPAEVLARARNDRY